MIPIRDTVPPRSFAFFNYLLIVINAVFFCFELQLGPRLLEPFILRYGLVPAVWTNPVLARDLQMTFFDKLSQLATSMFLHGGWMHVVSNLWILSIFGRSVEGKLGHFRYLILYVLAGLASGIFQLLGTWGSAVPTIGASGAIAGVMGAYFLLYPKARIVTLVPIFFLPWIVEIPAFIFLFVWFVSQLFSGVMSLGSPFGQIAWWAHVGGFVAGIYLVRRI